MSHLRSILAFSLALSTFLQSGCVTPEQREARFLARGKQRLQQKDYGRAVLDFRNAAKIEPTDDQAYYQLGWAFLQERDLRDAAVALKKATELNPRNTMAQVKLAELMALEGDEDWVEKRRRRV